MKKNSFRYKGENNHPDFEDEIDLDTGEVLEDPEDSINQKVSELVKWGESVRGKKFLDVPTQRKMIHDLRKAKITPTIIKQTFSELLHSDYWQKQDRLPDFKTVYSALKNKKV